MPGNMKTNLKTLLVRSVVAVAFLIPGAALATITFSGNVKFAGNLLTVGALSKGSGTFVIDHPLDPRNKLLFHSFVESPDAKNIYDGIATLDEKGEVKIQLPDYFQALNGTFRYQFFAVSQPMPNLHIQQEIKDNAFVIGGGAPGGDVSWQITGIRHDPYIKLNPIRNEVWKGPDEQVDRGECLFEPLCE